MSKMYDWVVNHQRLLQAIAALVAIVATVFKLYPYFFAWMAGPMFTMGDAFLTNDYRGFVRDYVKAGGPTKVAALRDIKLKWEAGAFKAGDKFAAIGQWTQHHEWCEFEKLVIRWEDETGQQYSIIFLPEGESKYYGVGTFYEGIPMQIPDFVPPGEYRHVGYLVVDCFGLIRHHRWVDLPVIVTE